MCKKKKKKIIHNQLIMKANQKHKADVFKRENNTVNLNITHPHMGYMCYTPHALIKQYIYT